MHFCGNLPVKSINLYIEGKIMVNITSEWIADLKAMTCRNSINKIIVSFEKQGESMFGTIDYIPLEMLRTWAMTHEVRVNIRKAIMEAEAAFLEACHNL
jgi:hypothetical protein